MGFEKFINYFVKVLVFIWIGDGNVFDFVFVLIDEDGKLLVYF